MAKTRAWSSGRRENKRFRKMALAEAVARGDAWTVRRLVLAACMQTDRKGRTALVRAIRRVKNASTLPLLIGFLVHEGKTDVDRADARGWTPLMHAAFRNRLDAVRFLVLEGGADVDRADADGWTALMYAALLGHLNVVRFLVREAGADADGSTARMFAEAEGHADVAGFLDDWCR